MVVCPQFLDFIVEHPGETSTLSKLLLPDRTLALLLGVTDNDLNDAHKKGSNLITKLNKSYVVLFYGDSTYRTN